MAVNYKVSLRYATSLLESSLEKNNLEKIASEVESVYRSINGSNELIRLLSNPVIKTDMKISVITEIFKNRISDDLLNFIRFVFEKGREEQLLFILNKFLDLRDEHQGVINVVVKTAFAFSPEQEEKLRKSLEDRLNKKVRFRFVIDKEIIGGFVAKVNDTIYDASISHQLELLKKEFLSGRISLN